MMKTEIVENLSFEDYLSAPGVSQSLLKLFDYDSGGCPALYKYKVEVGRKKEEAETDAMRCGRRYHRFLLEPDSFADNYAELTLELETQLFENALACKSKATGFSQRLGTFIAWKDAREAEGKEVVTCEEAVQLREMRAAILSNKEISEWFFFKQSRLEVAVFDGNDKSEMQLKCRTDIDPGGDALLDLKTARTAHPDEFAKVAWRLGYHIQAAFNIDRWRANGVDKRRFGFLAQDKFPPYLACIHWLGEDWIRYGRVRYRKMLLDLEEAIRLNDWPGYHSGELMPPSWAMAEIESVAA